MVAILCFAGLRCRNSARLLRLARLCSINVSSLFGALCLLFKEKGLWVLGGGQREPYGKEPCFQICSLQPTGSDSLASG